VTSVIFACMHADASLPAQSPVIYRFHALATLRGGHLCLVLTPNGEIKIWAEGVQQFNFLEGRWRLTELAERYRQWAQAIGDARLAEILFTAALNLAEARRGGIFVVVEDPQVRAAVCVFGRFAVRRRTYCAEEKTRSNICCATSGSSRCPPVFSKPSPMWTARSCSTAGRIC